MPQPVLTGIICLILVACFQMAFIPTILPSNTESLYLPHAVVNNTENPYCTYRYPLIYPVIPIHQ